MATARNATHQRARQQRDTETQQAERTTATTQPTAAVVLSGGSPNMGLMAGALAAIYKEGKTFNTFYTSGAGGFVGLRFVAPKGVSTYEALKATTEQFAISDSIYRWLPLGYKAFYKSGPFTTPLKRMAERIKLPANSTLVGDSKRRLYNDLVDAWVATITPTDLKFTNQGVCAQYPFVSDAFDFNKLRSFSGEFILNSYCIEDEKMVQWTKTQIGDKQFWASLSFPFVYPPTLIDGKHYLEGASQDPMNLTGLKQRIEKRGVSADTVVLIDILEPYRGEFIHPPKNLLDAFGLTIMTPVIALGEKVKKIYHLERRVQELEHQLECRECPKAEDRKTHEPEYPELTELKIHVPEGYEKISDWSFSNMNRLWGAGYAAGMAFVEAHGSLLPDRVVDGPDPVS